MFLYDPEGRAAKNRMHIDIRAGRSGARDMDERARLIRRRVPELVAAAMVREGRYGDVPGRVVMRDPEGNESCDA